MANPVTWFEIIGSDPIGLQKFYADVFGWKLGTPNPQMGNYSQIDNENAGIGGGIGGSMDDKPRVSVYIEVDDPQAYLDKAVHSGATSLMPATEIMPGLTIAMFADPQGNTMGLMKPPPM